jgi:uncharacterized protein with HEPN domain
MKANERNAAYLWDMLDSARKICDFTRGINIQEYLKDQMMQLAIERLIEIMGEAARRISDDFKESHPEIPWKNIIAQRNVLAHEYDNIRQELIWTVISLQKLSL